MPLKRVIAPPGGAADVPRFVPTDLEALVVRCLEKEPQRRPTMRELGERLAAETRINEPAEGLGRGGDPPSPLLWGRARTEAALELVPAFADAGRAREAVADWVRWA